MEWWVIILTLLGGTLFFLFLGLPVGVSFLLMDLVGTLLFMGGVTGLKLLVLNLEESLTSFTLLTIPMFILMGELMFHSRMAFRAINALDYWLGRIPGRLSLLAVGSGTLFAATSGSTMANTSLLGSVLIPEMRHRGYKNAMAIGPVIGSGGLAMLIPPSILAVILATLMEISVGAVLIGGILPGLVLASFYVIYILVRCTFQPHLAPPYEMPSVPLQKKIKETLIYVAPLGLIIFLVVGVIFIGVATPSEAASMGAVGTTLLALCYGDLDWRKIKQSLLGTVRLTTAMFIILMASTSFSQIIAFSGASAGLIEAVFGLHLSPLLLLITMQLILIFLGCFMDNLSMVMIALPIYLPLIRALNFNPLWFAVMVLINMDAGNLSPPFGLQLFVMKGVDPETPMADIVKATFPFFICEILVIVAIMIFPDIALFLPGLMRKG